jgi:aquaporin related protein
MRGAGLGSVVDFSIRKFPFSFRTVYILIAYRAVTLGLCLSGGLPYLRGMILIPFQLLGAMAAAGLVEVMFPGSINDVQTTLATGTSKVQGVFIEMILTSLLVFMVLMLAAEKTKVTFLAPVGIGLTLFTAELAGVYYTGGSLNPARTLGPAVASRKFTGEHWVYWIGPLLGACLATAYYRLIKLLHYEEANPDQDSSGGEFFEK